PCKLTDPAIYNWKFTATSVTSVTLALNPLPRPVYQCDTSAKLAHAVTNCNIDLNIHRSSNRLLEKHCNTATLPHHTAPQAILQMLQSPKLQQTATFSLLLFLDHTKRQAATLPQPTLDT